MNETSYTVEQLVSLVRELPHSHTKKDERELINGWLERTPEALIEPDCVRADFANAYLTYKVGRSILHERAKHVERMLRLRHDLEQYQPATNSGQIGLARTYEWDVYFKGLEALLPEPEASQVRSVQAMVEDFNPLEEE